MGEVYEAEDLDLRERVALKTLRPEVAGDTRMIARFKQEIQLSRKIGHPNVCRVFDLARHPLTGSEPDTTVFLTMELLEGETVESRLQREGSLTPEAAVPLLEQMAQGLDAAHRAGVIHRDLKPSNVMLVPGPDRLRAVITDFGLARTLTSADDTTATMPHKVIGTLNYMAPELLTGGMASVASDVYALGMVAFKMVTGTLPFAPETPFARAILRAKAPVPRPRSIIPAIDPAFDRAVGCALEPEPQRRFASASDFAKALRGRIVFGSVWLTTQRQRALLVAILLILGISAIYSFSSYFRPRPSAESLAWYQSGAVALRDNTYYRAVRALERATALDPSFVLAHARLADAYNELDNSERAKSEMLLALGTRRGHAITQQTDSLYVEALNRTLLGDFPGAIRIYSELENRVSSPEKAQVLVDLGRARERNDEIPKALEAYHDAAQLDPQNAAAHLRAAILLGGRQLKLSDANAEFDRAASIYEALSNTEGEAEVLFQRGYLASLTRRLPDARAALERAIQLSRAISTEHQELASLLQLSIVAYYSGDADQAQQIASNAVDRARRAGMASLAARGLSNLGFTETQKGDYGRGEKAFRDALDLAARQQMSRNEARARFGLASLHELRGAPTMALDEIAPALSFFHKAGFRLEELQCLTVIARANRDLGQDAEALSAFQREISAAETVDDRQQIALAEQGAASVLFDEEHWPEALAHFRRYYEMAKSISDREGMGRGLVNQAAVQWRLGRYNDAQRLLADESATSSNAIAPPLAAYLAETRAGLALSRGDFQDAEKEARRASTNPAATPGIRSDAEWIAGLAQARAGRIREGKRLAAKSIDTSSKLASKVDLADARLALSEILLLGGESVAAQDEAQAALEIFHFEVRNELGWRALAILARAKRQLGDQAGAAAYAAQASERLTDLGRMWNPDDFGTYLGRPDIRTLRRVITR